MSSAEFEAEIQPDRGLHIVILLSGIAAAIIGTRLIAGLSLDFRWRLLLATCWLADCGRGLLGQYRGALGVRLVRLNANGEASIVMADDRVEPARLMAGTRVFTHVAWLRLKRRDGRCHGELFIATRCCQAAWHRLQLVWRQSVQRFGHNGRA